MPKMKIFANFLQQQENNTSFNYELYNNDILISKVNKTFKSEIIETVGNIVSLDSTNNINLVEPFIIGFNGAVYSITKQSTGKYIVSGSFTEYNGEEAIGICRLNSDFTLDTSFAPLAGTPPSFFSFMLVKHKLLSDDSIMLYDSFQESGQSAFGPEYLAKYTPDGVIDATFIAIGFSSRVTDIAIDNDDNIYAVGLFTSYTYDSGGGGTGTVFANRIIKLTENGIIVAAFNYGSGFSVAQFIIAYNPVSDTVVVGGEGFYKGVNVNGLAEINSSGTRTSKYGILGNNGGGNTVTAMYFNPSAQLTISGYFNSYASTACNKIIRINNDGSRDLTLNSAIDINVPARTITGNGTFTYLGGSFTVYGGVSIDNFVKINNVGDVPPYSQYDFVGSGINAIFLDAIDNVLVGGAISIYANVLVPSNKTIIPIGADLEETIANTLENLEDFNQVTGIVYSQIGNVIKAEYTYVNINDAVEVLNIIDIPTFLDIYFIGEYNITDIRVRSPYKIISSLSPTISEFTNTSSTIKIFEDDINTYITQPISYVKSKSKIVSTQNNIWINISNLVKEDLESDISYYSEYSFTTARNLSEKESKWVAVNTDLFYLTTQVSSTNTFYFILDGYIEPNETQGLPNVLMTGNKRYLYEDSYERIYFKTENLIALTYTTSVNSTPININFSGDENLNSGYVKSIRLHNLNFNGDWIKYTFTYEEEDPYEVTINLYHECKYKNYDLVFKNKYGVLETLSMNKKSSKAININSTDYLRSIVDYEGDLDVNRHTSKQFNVSGNEEWILNTDFLPEYMNAPIKEAMLSEEMWLLDLFGNIIPVIKIDNSLAFKTSLNDNLIQYTIKVRQSHNTVNNFI